MLEINSKPIFGYYDGFFTALGTEVEGMFYYAPFRKGPRKGVIDDKLVLAARVRTLLKREGRAGAPLEQLGKLSVNELRREVMVENKPIDLTPKEYELLIYFKNNRAIALSRESILNAVWGYDYFGDLRTVDTHVKKLRAKLGECGTMIETVRGYGYRFEV